MPEHLVQTGQICETWLEKQPTSVQTMFALAKATLTHNAINGTPVRGGKPGLLGIIYPDRRIPGLPQLEIAYRIKEWNVLIVGCRLAP